MPKETIFDIIRELTELQVSIEQHAYYNNFAGKDRQMEWSNRLSQLTSKLIRRYGWESD